MQTYMMFLHPRLMTMLGKWPVQYGVGSSKEGLNLAKNVMIKAKTAAMTAS